MSMRVRFALLAMVGPAISCSSMAKSRQRFEFAQLTFEMPGDWQHSDRVFKGVATTIWMPEENDHKESISVIRSELAPAMEHASPSQLADLLAHAESFADAKVSPPQAVMTASGFSGARVEVDYVPQGQREHYRRVHVVLLDHASIIHVLYTAKQADPQLTALNTVLGTIREGED